jgi:hypothetical protein
MEEGAETTTTTAETEPFMKTSALVWDPDTTEDARSTDGFTQGVPEEAKGFLAEGLHGEYTLGYDQNGVASLVVLLQGSWNTVWENESTNQWNSYRGNLMVSLSKEDSQEPSYEYATISASRTDELDENFNYLQWDSLVQGSYTDPLTLDWAYSGAEAFSAPALEFTPTAWTVGNYQEYRGLAGSGRREKKYITGIGASFMRALDAGDASQIVIKNKQDT